MSKQKQAQLRKSVAPFATSDMKISIIQIINSFVPFFLLWFLAYQSLSISFWLSLPFSIVAAGFVVRIFIIFHDCTHMSFFKSGKANRILGTITGIITHFAFEKWKRDHSIHHATSSNLDKRGTGDVWVMTVDEYTEASFWGRLGYRLYRNPLVMFGLGPFYLFLISNRFNRKGAKRKERWNTYLINVSLVVIYVLLVWFIGWQSLLMVQLPIIFIAGSLGVWLFYVQHQFEDSYFENEEEWDYVKAAVDGSSYYKLPKVLQWLTGNIGFHHVHHLSPRVPNYQLEKAHESTPPLQKATTITLKTSLQSIRFRLYDQASRTFVSFKEYKAMQRQKDLRVSLKVNTAKFQEE
ncbi:fatty acid desaturase [Bacilli bacterium]|uniref:fatty acid desaturase n=1 Tax=Oceanobacillus caeni TaxID=405946 RepID=UPI0006223EBE|nr:fatty acid desaturase [Oceanobacillus caeni]KKE79262.1 fatty acid desaturase [Bacilli bacterium VT-13-104]PZD86811.1 fatty acid desaturase [Bacilli bacterium]MBU8790659.1 fatty acid desaturase [Oceanobacillus caeni]PZD88185.1 fatty acid desaturase [Bacilli bacterium]PZD91462.1 fatty acid desaturase [Bacilli bacterium]